MSHTSLPGGHNPSPYLRRYRLPQLGSGAPGYEELISPVDNCSKMAFISALNFQKKHFQLSAPVLRPPSVRLPTISSNFNESVACVPQRRREKSCIESGHVQKNASNVSSEQTTALLGFDVRLEIAELELRNSRLVEEYSNRIPSSHSEHFQSKNL